MIWANGNNAAEKVTFLVTLRKLINKFYSLRGAITSVWHFEESLQTQSFVAVVRRFTDAEMFPSKTTQMLEDHWKVHEQLFALKNFKLNVWFRKRITRKPLNYSQLNRMSFRRSLRLISRWWLAREIIIADEPTNKISIYAYRIKPHHDVVISKTHQKSRSPETVHDGSIFLFLLGIRIS